jgi:hypothetical protein
MIVSNPARGGRPEGKAVENPDWNHYPQLKSPLVERNFPHPISTSHALLYRAHAHCHAATFEESSVN